MTLNYRMNSDIRSSQLRLIDQNGEQLGIVSKATALQYAREANLDLVEIAPNAKPPVAKILDYGKFKFEQSKKDKEAKRKQRDSQATVKELWFRPTTGSHDIEIKLNHAKKFLDKGNHVKFGVRFKGRELSHMREFKLEFENIINQLEDIDIIKPVSEQGRAYIAIVSAKKT